MIGACLWLDLGQRRGRPGPRDDGLGTISALVGAIAVATQVPVLGRYPRHPVAWVIALTGLLWAFDGLCESWSAYGMAQAPVRWPADRLRGLGGRPARRASCWSGCRWCWCCYPTGRLMPERWRVVSIVVIAMACTLPLLLLVAPTVGAQRRGVPAAARHRHAGAPDPGRRLHRRC